MTDTSKKVSDLGPPIILPPISPSTCHYLETITFETFANYKPWKISTVWCGSVTFTAIVAFKQKINTSSLSNYHYLLSKFFFIIEGSLTTITSIITSKTRAQWYKRKHCSPSTILFSMFPVMPSPQVSVKYLSNKKKRSLIATLIKWKQAQVQVWIHSIQINVDNYRGI